MDQIQALEELKAAASAAQARATYDLGASQRTGQESLGPASSRVGEGIAFQVGPTRRDLNRAGPPARIGVRQQTYTAVGGVA